MELSNEYCFSPLRVTDEATIDNIKLSQGNKSLINNKSTFIEDINDNSAVQNYRPSTFL
jgi:hypothetical protein